MVFPILTGQAARILGITERQLQDLMRRGKVESPTIQGGRRLWFQADVRRAAGVLRVTTVDLSATKQGSAA